jgi:hypothetical protein
MKGEIGPPLPLAKTAGTANNFSPQLDPFLNRFFICRTYILTNTTTKLTTTGMSFEASSSSSIQPSVQTTIDVECSRSSKRRRANFDAEVAYYESNTLDLAEEEIVEEVEEDQ